MGSNYLRNRIGFLLLQINLFLVFILIPDSPWTRAIFWIMILLTYLAFNHSTVLGAKDSILIDALVGGAVSFLIKGDNIISIDDTGLLVRSPVNYRFVRIDSSL